jgi:Tfp pilus assembly protein PilF/peroxiredoxin
MAARFIRFTVTVLLVTACAVFLFAPAGATIQGLQVGMEAPDFSLEGINGETRKWADLRGEKLTAVVFWSTWSKKSETLLVRMQRLHEKYRDKGFSVVAINADDQRMSLQTAAEIRRAAERLKLGFPILLDRGLETFHEYGVIALPTTLLLDRERNIRYELSGYPLVGGEEMADFVAVALEGKKPASGPAAAGHQPNKNAQRLFNMGKNTLRSKRMADTAEIWFKKAIDADPDFILPRLSLGEMYLRRGDTSKAKGEFERVLAKEPGNVIALCEMGMALVNEGKVEGGKALLEKAMKTGDAYTPCYYYTGFVYGKSGNLEKALQMFDEASRMNPMDHNIHVYKARMYEENNRRQEAAAAYRKALEIILRLD